MLAAVETEEIPAARAARYPHKTIIIKKIIINIITPHTHSAAATTFVTAT